MTDSELRDFLCLSLVPGVGSWTFRALLERFGTATQALNASLSSLKNVPNIGPKLAEQIREARRTPLCDPEEELAVCDAHGVRVLTIHSPDYPIKLKEIPDPPLVLYVKGDVLPEDQLAIAIVGSRQCSPYGMRIADKLSASLARTGITVISGLARGIDSSAHRAALRAGGRTIAVLANGLAKIYPPENAELAAEIAQNGAIFSESPMTQEPLPGLFPQRNRLISGLSLGVAVIEATPRSGSLSTAKHAVEQNREVFAVPGPVDSLSSRGCHALIRDGAKLVENADDILEELGPLPAIARPAPRLAQTQAQAQAQTRPPTRYPARYLGSAPAEPQEETRSDRGALGVEVSENEAKLLAVLSAEPTAIDEVIRLSGLPSSQAMATLSILEVRRLVRRSPGPCYARYH